VLSRRSGGISVGVNLNPDKVCNFDCIYCQVDRTQQSETRFVELDHLLAELEDMLTLAASGELFEKSRWPDAGTVAAAQRYRFSGDGEPTTYQKLRRDHRCCAPTSSGGSAWTTSKWC
jgi:wyosine [tRNA(Phe)-imidazoG37] synthetase (radical SAM superfamily)